MLASKVVMCEDFVLKNIWVSTFEQSRDLWLDLAIKVCQTSKYLKYLTIRNTKTGSE